MGLFIHLLVSAFVLFSKSLLEDQERIPKVSSAIRMFMVWRRKLYRVSLENKPWNLNHTASSRGQSWTNYLWFCDVLFWLGRRHGKRVGTFSMYFSCSSSIDASCDYFYKSHASRNSEKHVSLQLERRVCRAGTLCNQSRECLWHGVSWSEKLQEVLGQSKRSWFKELAIDCHLSWPILLRCILCLRVFILDWQHFCWEKSLELSCW